jgi:hypothetical protein
MAKKKLYTRPLALLVSDDIHRKIMDRCDQQEMSYSEWIRDAIEQKLVHEHEKQHNKIKDKMEEK